jgi:NitT/TauT family transport system permease protein
VVIWPLLAFAVFLGIWQAISVSLPDQQRRRILPTPWSVLVDGFGDAEIRGDILRATVFTAKEALIGLAIAALIGISLAILMSQARWIERSVFPWAVALQTIPILALVPFIQIRFGYEFKARVIVCVLIAVFPIVTNTLFGLLSADEGHHDLFTLHRAGRWRRLWKLQFPGALPAIFTGLRISAGLAVVGAIVGEYFFRKGDAGLGHMIELYIKSQTNASHGLFATIIVTCLLGIIVFGAISLLASFTTRKWYEPAGTRSE